VNKRCYHCDRGGCASAINHNPGAASPPAVCAGPARTPGVVIAESSSVRAVGHSVWTFC